MGWKRFRERFRIDHIVHVTDSGVCIGSPFIPDIIVVGKDGRILARYDDRFSINEDLVRYQAEIEADPESAAIAISEPDDFMTSIPVYTWDGGEIIEKQCEAIGWPNVTHDGQIMYENRFFVDRKEALKRAIEDGEAGVKLSRRLIDKKEKELAEIRQELLTEEANIAKWKAELGD